MTFRLAPILALAGVVTLHAQQSRSTSRPVALPPGSSAAAPAKVPPCGADDFSLATDGEDGNFNGMSHSGTLVVLRNLSPHACSVRAIPQIQFSDKNGRCRPGRKWPVSRGRVWAMGRWCCP